MTTIVVKCGELTPVTKVDFFELAVDDGGGLEVRCCFLNECAHVFFSSWVEVSAAKVAQPVKLASGGELKMPANSPLPGDTGILCRDGGGWLCDEVRQSHISVRATIQESVAIALRQNS